MNFLRYKIKYSLNFFSFYCTTIYLYFILISNMIIIVKFKITVAIYMINTIIYTHFLLSFYYQYALKGYIAIHIDLLTEYISVRQ